MYRVHAWGSATDRSRDWNRHFSTGEVEKWRLEQSKTLAKAHNGTVYGQLRMGCGSLRQGWEGGLGTD